MAEEFDFDQPMPPDGMPLSKRLEPDPARRKATDARAIMVVKLSDQIRQAQEQAADCAERASKAQSLDEKATLVALEVAWTRLAASYKAIERLERDLPNISASQGNGGTVSGVLRGRGG